uniref:Succinate-semialdehyde dehydrogenase, mitochondrial n=1 Tax=Haptolina ericina TaxID=156174 RepID=A0A7S3AN93_9EUKA
MAESHSLAALDAAVASWNHGRGAWAQAKAETRIAKVEELMTELKASKRDEIINVLMWEICKTKADATKEFDRTMDYIAATISTYKAMLATDSSFVQKEGVLAQIKRAPLGVMLNLGPFNYPFNETYCTLIPAILMGNSVVMKLPNVGCLAHVCTMEIYAKVFPPGVVNFISGAGRTTMPPIMASGKVDIFAFIGGSTAADALLKQHPQPHKLKACLALDAKNLCVIAEDCDVAATVKECLTGTLSYNGQRCTALKLLMVHQSIAEEFVSKMAAAVDEMKLALPWEDGVKLTPLPEPNKPAYLRELIADAKSFGAKVSNSMGEVEAGPFVRPTVLYPCDKRMRVWTEEQFGPLIPIAPYNSLDDIYAYLDESTFGQQAAIFTSDPIKCGPLIDALANNVGRVNINAQCQRSPDSFPFTGRKSSALGTLSVSEALKVVSIESVVATKDAPKPFEQFNALASSSDCNSLTPPAVALE